MTGYAHHICWDYVRATLGLEAGECVADGPKKSHDLVRANLRCLPEEEFDTLLASVMKMSGYHEDPLPQVYSMRSLAVLRVQRHYAWPQEVRELVRQNRGVVGLDKRLLFNKVKWR